MNIQNFIHTAYSAQNDTGSLANFNQKFTAAHTMMEGKGIDPVAAFLAAVLVENGNDTSEAIEALDFFTNELLRAVQSLQKAAAD